MQSRLCCIKIAYEGGELRAATPPPHTQASPHMRMVSLKGPKHEIFEIEFFTQIRPVRIGDLWTGEKN
jgi:hypothetical protein